MIWTPTHTKLVGATVLLAVTGLGVSAYVHQRVLRAKSDATQAAQQQVQKQLADQKAQMEADFEAALKVRDAEYQRQTADLQRKFNGSMAQVLALINEKANLPVPLKEETPEPTQENPNPLPSVPVPQADYSAAKQYLLSCETCKAERTKLQGDLSDVQAQRAAEAKIAQQQIDSLKAQRDAAVAAAKGGNWIQRLGHNVKYLVIGAAGGVVAICGTGHCR